MKTYQHQVQYYETDKMQLTHHSNYIRFMEEARVDFLNQIGYGYDQMEKAGIISPVIQVTCDYKKSTTFLDIITMTLKVLEITPTKLKLGYTMTCQDEIVCTATSTHCFLNEAGRPIIIKKQVPKFYQILKSMEEMQ